MVEMDEVIKSLLTVLKPKLANITTAIMIISKDRTPPVAVP